MIIGIDHLALNVSDLTTGKNSLESNGFSCLFTEHDVPNDPAKQKLLSYYQPKHDLGLFRSHTNGMSIEIINHGMIADSIAPFYYHDDYIELVTSDVPLEKNFWMTVLGFQELNANLLTYVSMVQSWSCRLKLIEKTVVKPCSLDSSGYACLALLSNNISQDALNARAAGSQDMTTPFKVFLNGRHLEVMMFRTPGGAICELIQINRQV